MNNSCIYTSCLYLTTIFLRMAKIVFAENADAATKIEMVLDVNCIDIRSDFKNISAINPQNEENRIGMHDLVNKQLVRFEYQRNRLMQSFEITNSVQENNQIERLIFDIDSKLTNICLKIGDSKLSTWDQAVDYINKWMKKNQKDTRYLLYGDLLSTSENKKTRINKILKEK